MMNLRRLLYGLVVVAVVLVALGLRLWAVERLPQDYDEPVYFLAGQHYATALLEGDWAEFLHYDYNMEHPPLTKLAYAAVLSRLPQIPEIPEQPTNPPPPRPYPLPQPQFVALRLASALFGVLQVLALALLNPLAGLFLAIHTFTIKYTSQAYLEALPALTSTVAVLAYYKSKGRWNGWLVFSAVALGLTAAAKYLYCVAGIAVVIHWLWTRRPEISPRKASVLVRWWGPVVAWGLLAVATFFLADPFLWPDPASRLKASVLFNTEFSQSEHVRQSGYPIWQPFVWLLTSVPWHPGVFLVPLDVLITLLALLGFRRLWRERSVFAVWLVVGIGFLLLWPTKWPQYILILTAPLSLAAAVGFRAGVWAPLGDWLGRLRTMREDRARRVGPRVAWHDTRRALPWLLPGVIVLTLIALFPMIYQGAMSLTDFGAPAIRDGPSGGVWREVWRGLTGQAEAVAVDLFDSRPTAKEVHYAGPTLLLQLLLGAGASVALMTPLYLLLSALKLRTSLLGLMIVYAAFSMPFCIWNMRSAFQAVPGELEEAAFLDGAAPLTAFWRVTLPLALPAIAVAALIAFLIGYTEFAIGWLFVESSENVTLAMAVSGMQGQTGAWSKQAALALLMSVPVVAILIILQRYLLRGLLIGLVEE